MDIEKNSFNSMFGDVTDLEDNDLIVLDLDDLLPFHDHIFTRYSEEMMQELVNSIEDVGLLVPILVRDHPEVRGKFEILSGHNRVEACQRLGMKKVHARIFSNLSDDEAKLIVIETNLKQRNIEDFKPSERAMIVAERHNLMKRQGLRTDLIREIEDQRNENESEKKAPFHLGKSQIANYIRIHEFLNNQLQQKMDDGKLSIKAGVELSYLEPDEQDSVSGYINEGLKITDSNAKVIRKKALDAVITKDVLIELFTKKKKESKDKKTVKLPSSIIEHYFSETENEDEILDVVQMALEQFFKSGTVNVVKNTDTSEGRGSVNEVDMQFGSDESSNLE